MIKTTVIKILIVLTTVLFLESCFFTTLSGISGEKVYKNTTTKKITDTDNAIALGELILPEQKEVTLVTLVGEKHTYVITKNAKIIKALSTQLEDDLISINNGKAFEINANKDRFEGILFIQYHKPINKLSTKELNLLTDNKFILNNNTYQKYIEVEGVVRGIANNIDNLKYKFKKKRKIIFYALKKETKTELSNFSAMTRLVTVPVGIYLDIITFPIQLAVFAVMSIKETLE
jgi:hypothetical protein